MPVRRKRQRGYGQVRDKRQRGYGGGASRRIFVHRRNQVGRGEKWDKFKRAVRKGWDWARPKVYSAGMKALPSVKELVLSTPPEERRQVLKSIGKQFGKDMLLQIAGR